ncbi:hypothetical protein DUNSADRAFT_18419 [Dunaliella salina]|uniref:Encoded protein n=1 Tax=Dunaliella salina TaxID=3046 RepID=A0ABQ7GZ43_DUNSA|nr:hypothetical protein DUNSADRAFT_18419 [Dunaliella salina]|eukprot:KAF5839876.1 hypothetical protein DUNSADRAFT_18419 [Dunaliella salina]
MLAFTELELSTPGRGAACTLNEPSKVQEDHTGGDNVLAFGSSVREHDELPVRKKKRKEKKRKPVHYQAFVHALDGMIAQGVGPAACMS